MLTEVFQYILENSGYLTQASGILQQSLEPETKPHMMQPTKRQADEAPATKFRFVPLIEVIEVTQHPESLPSTFD